jgi:hypothetical protein
LFRAATRCVNRLTKFVKLEKLVKQIGRDATANPKKAALLGVMALLALYFWAPLLAGWIAPTKRKAAPTGNLALILTDDPVEATEKTKAAQGGNFRWEKVHQLMTSDPRMSSAEFDISWESPFAVAAALQEITEATEAKDEAIEKAAALSKDISPEEAGLVASCVLIGPRRRTVMINGEVYGEQQTIVAPVKDGLVGLEFRLVSIGRKEITFEREGRTYSLELMKSGLAEGDQIQRTNKATD